MEFPRFVFRCPGAFQRAGGSYGYLSVADEEAHAKAIGDGWFATLPDAIEAHDKPKVTHVETAKALEDLASEVAKADAPPSRAELEQKAKELGLKFDGRTTDKKLAALIAAEV